MNLSSYLSCSSIRHNHPWPRDLLQIYNPTGSPSFTNMNGGGLTNVCPGFCAARAANKFYIFLSRLIPSIHITFQTLPQSSTTPLRIRAQLAPSNCVFYLQNLRLIFFPQFSHANITKYNALHATRPAPSRSSRVRRSYCAADGIFRAPGCTLPTATSTT